MIVFTSKNLKTSSLKFAEDCVEKYCLIKRQSKNQLAVLEKRPLVLKDEMGKPYIEGDLCLSISHTSSTLGGEHNIIVVAISTTLAGVDVEISRQVDVNRISDRYFNEEEQKEIKTSRDFFRMWTRKEALYKALRNQKGIFMPKINTLATEYLNTYDIYENVIMSVYSEDTNIYFYSVD